MAKILVDDFIRIWNSSFSHKEVAIKTGLTPDGTNVKANYLRRRGYELKNLRTAKQERKQLEQSSDHEQE